MLAPRPHTHTQLPRRRQVHSYQVPTASPSGQHTGRGRQQHTHRDTSRRRFMASKASKVQTHRPQTYSERQEYSSRQGTTSLLYWHTRVNTGCHTVLILQHKQEHVLRESGAGRRPLTLLTGLQLLPLSGLSPHLHSLPPGPAGRRQKLFADNSPPFPCVAPPAAS